MFDTSFCFGTYTFSEVIFSVVSSDEAGCVFFRMVGFLSVTDGLERESVRTFRIVGLISVEIGNDRLFPSFAGDLLLVSKTATQGGVLVFELATTSLSAAGYAFSIGTRQCSQKSLLVFSLTHLDGCLVVGCAALLFVCGYFCQLPDPIYINFLVTESGQGKKKNKIKPTFRWTPFMRSRFSVRHILKNKYKFSDSFTAFSTHNMFPDLKKQVLPQAVGYVKEATGTRCLSLLLSAGMKFFTSSADRSGKQLLFFHDFCSNFDL